MNLAPIRVEYSHGDGARWPIGVDNKLDRTRNVLGVGAPFTNDLGRAVEELDSGIALLKSSQATTLILVTFTQSAVVAPSLPLIDADSLPHHLRHSKREPTRFKRSRPPGDRAAMNKHHPYALSDDPLPICRPAPWQCRLAERLRASRASSL